MKEKLAKRLSNIDFFKHLDKEDLSILASNSDLTEFGANEVLYYENDRKSRVYFLLDGKLKFYRVDRFDNEIFMYYLIDFGMVTDFIDMSSLEIKDCYANAVFSKQSEILSVDSEVFVKLVKKDFKFYQNFINQCKKRLERLESVITRDVVYDGTAKVAFMIANDLKNFNSLKKHEIAYELHIQPETLSRILAKMVRNELILVQKSRVKILNEIALKEIYE